MTDVALPADADARTLVVVDDEEMFLNALGVSLRRLHPEWRVLTTTDSRHAMELLRSEDVDVLVTDLGMPNVDGLELLVNAASISPSTGTVLMTGHTSNPSLSDVRRRGVTVLEKPFPLQDAARAIEEHLSRRESQFSGALSLSLEDLVQVLVISRRDAIVRIRMGARTGSVWFHQGAIVHAVMGHAQGEEAFYAILARRGGRFAVDAFDEPEIRSIDARWEELLMEGCRRLDERIASVSTGEFEGIEAGDWFDEQLEEARSVPPPLPVEDTQPQAITIGTLQMADVQASLGKLMEIDGATACCVVDSNSGMMLGSAGGSSGFNLEVAAAGNTEVVRAKRKTMSALKLSDSIDDILITMKTQYHLIRPLRTNDALFIYLVLDKARGNLAMARHVLASVEGEMRIG